MLFDLLLRTKVSCKLGALAVQIQTIKGSRDDREFLEISFKRDGQYGPLCQQSEAEIIQLICRCILKPGQPLPSSLTP